MYEAPPPEPPPTHDRPVGAHELARIAGCLLLCIVATAVVAAVIMVGLVLLLR